MIVIICGLPGSGKSFFASLLAARIKAEYINSDRIRKKLFGRSQYSEEERIEVYNEMLHQLKCALQTSQNAVLDATFYKGDFRDKFIHEIQGKDECFVIEVRAKQPLIRKRLSQPRAYSEADFRTYKKIKNLWEPITEEHLLLNSTNDNIENMLLDALRYLHRHELKAN